MVPTLGGGSLLLVLPEPLSVESTPAKDERPAPEGVRRVAAGSVRRNMDAAHHPDTKTSSSERDHGGS